MTRVKTPGFIVVAQVNDMPLTVEGPTHRDQSEAVKAAEAVADQLEADSDISWTVFVLPATQVS